MPMDVISRVCASKQGKAMGLVSVHIRESDPNKKNLQGWFHHIGSLTLWNSTACNLHTLSIASDGALLVLLGSVMTWVQVY